MGHFYQVFLVNGNRVVHGVTSGPNYDTVFLRARALLVMAEERSEWLVGGWFPAELCPFSFSSFTGEGEFEFQTITQRGKVVGVIIKARRGRIP